MPALRACIRDGVEAALAANIQVAPGKFGVLDCYDSAGTLHWELAPGSAVCPAGAAVLFFRPLARVENGKVRRAEKTKVAIAATLGAPPDYIDGLTQGFDGHAKWSGVQYGEAWNLGFADGALLRSDLVERTGP